MTPKRFVAKVCRYASGEIENIVVPVTERVVERTIPARSAVRKVEANTDFAALAEFDR